MGGCLCHSYIIHVLWLGEDVSFPCLLLVLLFFFLLIGKVHTDSGALSGIAFYLPVSGKCPEEPLKTISTMFPLLAQHPGWGSCLGLTPRAATSQNDPKDSLPLCGTTTSNQPLC